MSAGRPPGHKKLPALKPETQEVLEECAAKHAELEQCSIRDSNFMIEGRFAQGTFFRCRGNDELVSLVWSLGWWQFQLKRIRDYPDPGDATIEQAEAIREAYSSSFGLLCRLASLHCDTGFFESLVYLHQKLQMFDGEIVYWAVVRSWFLCRRTPLPDNPTVEDWLAADDPTASDVAKEAGLFLRRQITTKRATQVLQSFGMPYAGRPGKTKPTARYLTDGPEN